MRMPALFVVALLFAQSNLVTVAQVSSNEPAPVSQPQLNGNVEKGQQTGDRQYVFECSYKKGKNILFGLPDEQAIATPRIIVKENEPAKLEILSQSPFVTSVQIVRNPKNDIQANQPVITVLEEGYSITVKITAIDDQFVQLDAQFELQQIDHVGNVELKDCTTQDVTHSNMTMRAVRAVRLGEKLQLRLPPTADKEKPTYFEYSIKAADRQT